MQELAELGITASAVPGGVAFGGGWEHCYRANLWSRIASRILWRIAEFDYRNEHDLYEAVKRVEWPRYFRVEHTLRVNVTAQKSPLKSLEFATLRIKDAVCDRFRDALGKRPSVDRTNPDVRVHAFLESARAMLYLDTSGEPLFKRGWRSGAADAPLRENLAAGILMLTGWQPEEPLLDPMCGGGTFLVEGQGAGGKTSLRFRATGRIRRRAVGTRQARNPRQRALAQPVRQRHRSESAERNAAQSCRGRRRALGEARAGGCAGARGTRDERRDADESALRRAHGQRR